MSLIAIAHKADQETGLAKLTYDQLCAASDVSRAKLSQGLEVLESHGIIERWQDGRSSFLLSQFDLTKGWCK